MPNTNNQIFVNVIRNDLPMLDRVLPGRFDQKMDALAEEGVNISKLSIQQSPATGRTYGNHTASSPGHPPRIDTGRLVNSITWRKSGKDRVIVAATEYAVHLEFGTTRIEPRPFMGPMAHKLRQLIRPTFNNFLEGE